MKLASDEEIGRWLEAFEPTTEDFDWDAGNSEKNRKHGVSRGDVESLFTSGMLFEGRIIEPSHDEDRYLLLGRDSHSRPLSLIFTLRDGKVRPISCRPMRRKERAKYEEYTK